MGDPRVEKLAKILVNYSINVKKGEYIKIAGSTKAKPLILALFKEVLKKGAFPRVDIGFPEMSYIFFKNASKEQLKHFPKLSWEETKKIQAYIGIGAPNNTRELANIDPKKMALRQKVTEPISRYIVNGKPKIRRCTTDYPTAALAQDANMSLQEFEDFLFSSTNMAKSGQPISQSLQSTQFSGRTAPAILNPLEFTLSVISNTSLGQ